MNPETENLLRQLELATSPGDVEIEALDEETAMLRETWVSFGRLLSTVERPQHEPAIAASKARRSASTVLGWVAGIALSIAALSTLAWYAMQADRTSSLVKTDNEKVLDSRPANGTQDSNAVEVANVPAQFSWDDTFDDQLAEAHSAMGAMWRSGDRRDALLTFLHYEFQEIDLDLEQNSL